MSKYFGDFVCRRLGRTVSHLNLMISRQLPEDAILKYSLSPVENFLPLLPQSPGDRIHERLTTTNRHRLRSQPRMFLINFKHVDEKDDPNILSWTTLQKFYTYKIPMSFRGMRKV